MFKVLSIYFFKNVIQRIQNLLKMFHTQLNIKEDTRYLIQIINRTIIVLLLYKSKDEKD